MHPAAATKTHVMRRVMQRLPGVCVGQVLRDIDDLILDATAEPLVMDDRVEIYRLALVDGRVFVAVVGRWNKHLLTVMNVPCQVHASSRLYHVEADSIQRIKNVNRIFRDDQRWRKQQKRTPQIRFL
jgi:hypothetical protein